MDICCTAGFIHPVFALIERPRCENRDLVRLSRLRGVCTAWAAAADEALVRRIGLMWRSAADHVPCCLRVRYHGYPVNTFLPCLDAGWVARHAVPVWRGDRWRLVPLLVLACRDGNFDLACALHEQYGICETPTVLLLLTSTWCAPGIRSWLVQTLRTSPARLSRLLRPGRRLGRMDEQLEHLYRAQAEG